MKLFLGFLLIINLCSTVYNYGMSNESIVINRSGLVNWRTNVETDLSEGLPIISIATDNVILDLEGFTLSQDPSNTATGIIGVEVAANVENIVIRNGTISSINGIGIKINDGAKNIAIENMIIDHCLQAGILLDGKVSGTGIEDMSITACNITSCTGINAQAAAGINIAYTTKFEITDCDCLKNDAQTTSTGYGLIIDHGQFGRITDCNFIDNGGNALAVGCYIFSCTNIVVQDCITMYNRARSSSSGALALGFYVKGGDCIIFDSCESLQNIATTQKSCGFRIESGTGNIVRHCIAEKNYCKQTPFFTTP